jgi:pimeloyl-ACP methyl ester carboxylesterase
MTRSELTSASPSRFGCGGSEAVVLPLGDGQQVRFLQCGLGPDVVLIHGTLVTLEDPVIALMEELSADHRVTAVDRPGHGLSTRPRGHGTLAHQVSFLRHAFNRLRLRRPILVGHSAGATVAAAYALEYPDEVTGTVCLAPIVLPELRLEHILFGPRETPFGGDLLGATVGPFMDASLNPLLWRAMFLPQQMPERFAAAFPFDLAGKAGDMQALAEESIALIPDLLIRLARFRSCRVATAVLTGDRDVVVNPIHGRMLAKLLPNALHRSVPGLGHMVHHFAASEVADTVRQMRASVGAGGAGP